MGASGLLASNKDQNRRNNGREKTESAGIMRTAIGGMEEEKCKNRNTRGKKKPRHTATQRSVMICSMKMAQIELWLHKYFIKIRSFLSTRR